ncbi:hypothetical protein PV325_001768 [Microctonus aethiopoides]|nr:hypothetical protein PV325_001768 [Microctonus aethiopoides]KAK0097667.1 hypothetical protein PV326_000349 [Microctonus aethiopoides]
MHTVAEVETHVPAFLGKLWKLVDDPETDDLICWASNGRSFFIKNTAQFARELLPHYYKHNNMASFVRQLNMYGFHKKVSIEVGGLKCDKDEMEFAHQYFVKDHPYLLDHIKRKIASAKAQDNHPPIKSEVMNKVLNEVRSMRGRQEHLDSRLGAMKRENEALWRELAMLRRKHLKQQEIVNKLIHFLVTLVQPSRSSGRSVKRRYPLMIDAHQQDKQMKMAKPETSPTGPVIHELDPSEHEQHGSELNSQYITPDILDQHEHPAIQSPESIADILDDDSAETVHYIAPTSSSNNIIHVLDSKKNVYQDNAHKLKKKGEEIIMLESSLDNAEMETLNTEKKSSTRGVKRVPDRTVRSSKLAAMARNIKMNEPEDDVDSDDNEDDPEAPVNFNDVNFEDIFIIPDGIETNDDRNLTNKNDNVTSENRKKSNEFVGNDIIDNINIENDASSSGQSKDWSLSCVNSSNATNSAAYRLGPKEEVGNHVVSVQNDLDQLRDTLLNEGYTIDANTLLGLFGGDDPMSFGIPMNPELNPSRERDDDDHIDGLNNGAPGGELMTYTPSTSLLDFDDDILLDPNNLDSGSRDSCGNDYYNENPLNLSESKTKLLESLVLENESNPSAST